MKFPALWRAAALLAVTAGAVWLLVFSGWLNPEVAAEAPGGDAFQQVFWEERPLDLALQACLIIAGALGVAAILPAGDEE
jgi:hypothetical protein